MDFFNSVNDILIIGKLVPCNYQYLNFDKNIYNLSNKNENIDKVKYINLKEIAFDDLFEKRIMNQENIYNLFIKKIFDFDKIYKENDIPNSNINFIIINLKNRLELMIKSIGKLLYINYIQINRNCIDNNTETYLKKINYVIYMEHKNFFLYKKKIFSEYKILLILTTYNEIVITEECIKTLLKSDCNMDLIIIDDFSNKDNIKFLAAKYNIPFIGKSEHKGLTNSWNLGYKYFLDNNYDVLYISNNDIKFPTKTINFMTQNLMESDNLIVVPSSTIKGAGIGKCQKLQGLENIPNSEININDPKNYELVQNYLIENNVFENQNVNYFTGFLFGMKKKIRNYEYSDNKLFNPKKINLCNEIDLYTRILEKTQKNNVLYCKNAFVYHYKAVTIDVNKRDSLKQIENKYL